MKEIQELCKYLEEFRGEEVDCIPVVHDLEESTLIQILKDIKDTSWGIDVLDSQKIEHWLENFKGKVFDTCYERILALILAINIVYYNEDDISYLVKVAYRRVLHEIMETQNIDVEEAIKSLVFCPLGRVSESGPFLSYYFRKENNLSIDFFISDLGKLNESEQLKKNIVLLDDVSISGGQVVRYLDRQKNRIANWDKIVRNRNVFALFMLSTKDAQKILKQKNVYLCSPIIMDRRSKCFDPESVIYRMFSENIRETIRMQSKYMSQRYGYELLVQQYYFNGELNRLLFKEKWEPEKIREKIMKDALGYDDSEMLLAFAYNTPNNCLPIFWVENGQWNPLFKRFDKLYVKDVIGGIQNDTIFI